MSVLLITHDLGVVAQIADKVGVMYASRLVEIADVATLFSAPHHPYTTSLFKSLPRLGEKKERLETIPGSVPNPLHFPAGCTFHPRCFLTRQKAAEALVHETVLLESQTESFRVLKRCATDMPLVRETGDKHWCSCFETPGYADAPVTNPAHF